MIFTKYEGVSSYGTVISMLAFQAKIFCSVLSIIWLFIKFTSMQLIQSNYLFCILENTYTYVDTP